MNGFFIFESNVSAVGDGALNNRTFKNLWKGFCFGCSHIDIKAGEKNTFILGDAIPPSLPENKEYAVCVTEKGVAIKGKDYDCLMRGIIWLLMKIDYISLEKDKASFKVATTNATSNYLLKNRMIHICIFPETDIYFIKKLIRLSAVCQYTHIVLEFWGMLKYDCLKELAWECAFTKEQAKELITEAKELGIKPIPMFNQLGHATASRLSFGKHVVLDQNPALQDLFTPDGWAWNIENPKVDELLRKVRLELYELFGDTEFIHLGCDEAFYYTKCDSLRKKLPVFLKNLTDSVVREGKRPMVWMDMMLEKGKYKDCCCDCRSDEVEIMQNSLNKKTVMVDWQYDVKEAPIESLLSLKDNGYDVIGASWLNVKNIDAHIKTVCENDMFGIMVTTWHTVRGEMYGITEAAKKFGATFFDWTDNSGLLELPATIFRKLSFEGNCYEQSGWLKNQVNMYWQ